MNLTKPQQLVYDMERFSGGAIATICGSILFEGTKEPEEIKSAINKMYKDNDALRIKITDNGTNPSQEVCEYQEQDVSVLWFMSKNDFRTYAEKVAKEPMDIYGNLVEITGVVVENSYGFLVKIHHIISDAWTLSLIGTQFAANINNETLDIASYKDYVATENEYLMGKRFEKDKKYWIETFSRCDEPLYISEINTKSTKADRKTITVNKENTAVIAEYAQKTESSMYQVMMTAIAVYFNRIKNNAEKFYIGTAVLNRSNFQEKNTMGMFINTVPVLIELDNDETFEENMKKVTKSSLGVFRHQRFNYGDILKTIREEFKFDEKLYDVMFSYQNATVAGEDFETTWYHCGEQNESLQIHIDDRDSDGTLTINYDYNTDKFTENEIERMHGHIFNLLFDATENFYES